MLYKPDRSNQPIILTTHIKNRSSQTLLDFLVGRFHYHGRTEWESLIEQGRVMVNGLKASAGQPLRAGDEVTYETAAWKEPEVNPHYRMVYEDEALLALSKPAPLPVHAIGAYFKNTLMHLLRRDRIEARDFHLVHRLDSETSGLLLLVKNKKLLIVMKKQWDAGEVRKTYQAIVFGKFPKEKHVTVPIGPKSGSKIRMKLSVIGVDGGKTSTTEFKRLEMRGSFSLVEAKPLTGRTHQIRVHLEHLGYPIVGDKLYSGNDETFLYFHKNGWDEWLRERVLLPRLALHAFKLEFTHPETGKRMTLEDPLPADLTRFWNENR